MFNKEGLDALIIAYKGDKYRLKLINSSLRSFAEYHKAVCELEFYKKVFFSVGGGDDDYKQQVEYLDSSRTRYHDNLLSSIEVLNRMAEKAGTPLVYTGIVSKEQPYRRMIADEVFAFVEELVKNRS